MEQLYQDIPEQVRSAVLKTLVALSTFPGCERGLVESQILPQLLSVISAVGPTVRHVTVLCPGSLTFTVYHC